MVTIVTPAYNRASLIAETIESVLGQDYPDIEYIVLDDGSTDNTADVIRQYECRLRWTRHDNMGEARTVNRGLELSHGEIIGVVNSDDPLRPGAISAMVEAMLDDPDAVVVYPDWEMIDIHGDVLRRVARGQFTYLDMIRLHQCVPGPGALFRRAVYEQIGGRDPSFRFVNDFDFWLRAGLLGAIRHLPRTLATWRHHAEGATSAFVGVGMAYEYVAVMSKLFAQPDLPAEVRAVEVEALTNAFHTAGIVASRASTAFQRRFIISDALWDERFAKSTEELVGSLAAEIERNGQDLKWLHTEVAKRDETISWLHAEVAQRDSTITWLHQEVAQRDQTVARLHGEVANRAQTIDLLRQQRVSAAEEAPAPASEGQQSL